MPVLGRRPAVTVLPSGETVVVVSEAASYSVPTFTGTTTDGSLYLTQDRIFPPGTRIAYSLLSSSTTPVPVLCSYKDTPQSAAPVHVFPLHNAIDPTLLYDGTRGQVHLLWWWNGWTPTIALPAPPKHFYDMHSVPDPLTPPWLRSLVPKAVPAPFDPRAPFWVAPIPEGYQYDYYPGVVMGESRANGPNRIPDTPGGRYLQGIVARGLVDFPPPTEAPFNAVPSPERDDWERRGGVVAAGEHLRVASLRDTPEFIPTVAENPYTHELEMAQLPGVGVPFPPTTTWEDHLTIVAALKSPYDHANLGNATRVLMWASGFLHDNVRLTTVPRKFNLGENQPQGPAWPDPAETVTTSLLLLEFPRVVAAFPTVTNYRTTINPDKVRYPYLDYPDIGTVFATDGYLVDSATSHTKQHAAVDWVISDPSDCAAQLLDLYRNHLDNRSY